MWPNLCIMGMGETKSQVGVPGNLKRYATSTYGAALEEEKGIEVRGQGESATKPGSNSQNFRLPPQRHHGCASFQSNNPKAGFPRIPERKERNKRIQLNGLQLASLLSNIMGTAQEAIQWLRLVKLYNFLESLPQFGMRLGWTTEE